MQNPKTTWDKYIYTLDRLLCNPNRILQQVVGNTGLKEFTAQLQSGVRQDDDISHGASHAFVCLSSNVERL